MAKARIELPDGRIATIEIPDGMSMEEAGAEIQSMYDTDPAQFGAPAPQQPPVAAEPAPVEQSNVPQDAPTQNVGVLQQLEQAASKYVPPYGVLKGMATMGPVGSELESYGRGVASGVKGFGTGARQLFNKVTGDDAELAQLNEQEALARALLSKDTGEFPLSSSAGKLVGQIAPSVLGGAALPAGAVAGSGSLLARTLAGAGAGGLSGGATALTPEEEASGQRGSNAVTGALLGGALPAVTTGLGKAVRSFSKLAPEDALEDFAKRQLGTSHEKGALGAYRAADDAIESKYRELQDAFKPRYEAVEAVASKPVPLVETSRLGEEVLSLPDEVAVALSPTAKRVLQGVTRGATKTSEIVDTSGRAIKRPREVSFADVRESVRELRAAGRSMPKTDTGQNQKLRLDAIINRLDDDLAKWAGKDDEAAGLLAQAKQVDSDYAQQVAPFTNRKETLGALRQGQSEESELAQAFLGKDAGMATSDLLERVPEARGPVRELYGQNLLTQRSATPQARALEGGTLGEVVLDRSERAYLKRLATSVKKTGGTASLSPTLEGIVKAVGGDKLSQMLYGIERYSGKDKVNPNILADILRAYSAGQVTGE